MSFIPKYIDQESRNEVAPQDSILTTGAPPFVPKMVSCTTVNKSSRSEALKYKLPGSSSASFTAPASAPAPAAQATVANPAAPSQPQVQQAQFQQPQVQQQYIQPQNTYAANPASSYAAAGSQSEEGMVNQITYAVLAFFLGCFGAQFFYTKKYVKGVLCVVFCWTFIPELIGIIQAVIAFTKKPDSNGNIPI